MSLAQKEGICLLENCVLLDLYSRWESIMIEGVEESRDDVE